MVGLSDLEITGYKKKCNSLLFCVSVFLLRKFPANTSLCNKDIRIFSKAKLTQRPPETPQLPLNPKFHSSDPLDFASDLQGSVPILLRSIGLNCYASCRDIISHILGK